MLNALVLSGGVALGAFEAGICAALEAEGSPRLDWVAGASAGAVNAAIFAGNPPELRAARLRQFWEGMAEDPVPGFSLFFGAPPDGLLRRAHNRAAALQSLLFGRPGLFTPRLSLEAMLGLAPSLYDLAPLRRRLPEVVDFDRLNDGGMRVTLVAVDVASGERVVFDTARGKRIGPEHVVASCALLPLFAPVEVEGRLLGDGGLASNAPVDLVLEEGQEVLCILAELFAATGQPPSSLSGSLVRAGDLALGNQTQRLLEGHARLLRLRESLHRLSALLPEERRAEPELAALLAEAAPPARATVLRIGYRAAPHEAGAGKLFDFSRATTADRWKAGEEALRQGLRQLAKAPAPGPGLVLHEVESRSLDEADAPHAGMRCNAGPGRGFSAMPAAGLPGGNGGSAMPQTPPINAPGAEQPAAPQTAENTCRRCGGSGQLDNKPCPACDGRGTVPVTVGDA